MKKLLLILLISGVTLHLFAADDVVFKAQAPAQVIVGKPFQLTYTINQRAKDLRVPEFTDFDHIAGPFQSQSSSTSFVNGKRTSTFTLSFTYTLIGLKEGTYTIAPATIKVDGNQHTSNGVRITVLPPDQANAASSASQGNTNAASSQVADNETIFVRTLVSKTKVHEQEAIVVSYKLYFSGVEIAQLTNNTRLPEF